MEAAICILFVERTVTASTLHELSLYCMNKLDQCGLNVKIVVCDQGENNHSMLHSHLHLTLDRSFFIHNEKTNNCLL